MSQDTTRTFAKNQSESKHGLFRPNKSIPPLHFSNKSYSSSGLSSAAALLEAQPQRVVHDAHRQADEVRSDELADCLANTVVIARSETLCRMPVDGSAVGTCFCVSLCSFVRSFVASEPAHVEVRHACRTRAPLYPRVPHAGDVALCAPRVRDAHVRVLAEARDHALGQRELVEEGVRHDELPLVLRLPHKGRLSQPAQRLHERLGGRKA
mmetsp:Transcript_289/g.638  ORF Transcript_289/g.638 Transcript_289/m.638 type:complete len:210 (-) Transcript_289:387-1016(-)